MPQDWIEYLPKEESRKRQSQRRRLRRLQVFRRRGFWIGLCVAVYALWCLSMLVSGDILAFSFALIPLVTMPAIAWLTWWLVFRDFHQ
jgi:hypothetical protein